ncbi:(2Fe-2S)-binding protein [Rhizobium leguminosarum]|jgi:nicotinate dehydrogenase subunit A|uniref:2Fe-2S iron-sulfur cluster binding domain-containing protein n=1 Tax=Rhizobium leguminosarum TaxID=384 RepID=A0A7K3VL87_RHILE|nr:(2Fe-2S)-binding protein [Rhizobium leguminosarum]NEK17889.1 2Fe-2S iron-sulfur cluster binding domain-containing protein [Rhizobium leguminosarum]
MKPSVSVSLNVNDALWRVSAKPETPLLYILRNDLCLNGPKYGCGLGECGACAVLVDGRPVRSCTVPLGAIGKRRVITLEGLAVDGLLHPVQQAFIEEAAAQCGYCLNGMIIATVGLLQRNTDPDESDIRDALRHHLCRCGTHVEILAAVRRAVTLTKAGRPVDSMTNDMTEVSR